MTTFQDLPNEIKSKIFEYDPTNRELFNKVIHQIRFATTLFLICERIVGVFQNSKTDCYKKYSYKAPRCYKYFLQSLYWDLFISSLKKKKMISIYVQKG